MNDKKNLDRRGLLSTLAVVGAGAALAACGTPSGGTGGGSGGSAGGGTGGTGGGSTGGGTGGSTGGGSGGGGGTGGDVALLNALLSAEYKAIDAYTQGAGVLSAPGSTDPLKDLAPVLLSVAVAFQTDHKNHAKLLDATIKAAGGTPTTEAANKYTLPTGFKGTVLNVLKLAANEEKKAAIAYNGVIESLGAAANRFIGASIQGDETQHFVVLSAVIEGLVKPTANFTSANAGKIVPKSFVATTDGASGGDGLDKIADISTSDMM